jgi:hypothetical protein
MTKADVQQLVLATRAIQKKNGDALSERTIVDHLTAIPTITSAHLPPTNLTKHEQTTRSNVFKFDYDILRVCTLTEF